MDVMNVEQAKIASAAGAVAVMALERIPADIRRRTVASSVGPSYMIKEIKNAVTIPCHGQGPWSILSSPTRGFTH
jgi:pyridoxal 5'-phosphate synthase pdxS subunit